MPVLRAKVGTSVTRAPSMKISPSSGSQEAGDEIEQRCLAAAGWTKQRHELTAPDVQPGIVESDAGAKAFAHAVELYGNIGR